MSWWYLPMASSDAGGTLLILSCDDMFPRCSTGEVRWSCWWCLLVMSCEFVFWWIFLSMPPVFFGDGDVSRLCRLLVCSEGIWWWYLLIRCWWQIIVIYSRLPISVIQVSQAQRKIEFKQNRHATYCLLLYSFSKRHQTHTPRTFVLREQSVLIY